MEIYAPADFKMTWTSVMIGSDGECGGRQAVFSFSIECSHILVFDVLARGENYSNPEVSITNFKNQPDDEDDSLDRTYQLKQLTK
jgi:hypothetical protein